MNCSKKNVWVIVLLLAFFSFPHVVFANKASVTIEAPESAVKESEMMNLYDYLLRHQTRNKRLKRLIKSLNWVITSQPSLLRQCYGQKSGP